MVQIDSDSRRRWFLAAMGGVVGVILLDETVVGVALPTMRAELGLSQVSAHWVINAYLLVFAGLAAAGGKLGDMVGHGPLFVVGVIIFGLASLACGFAADGSWLIGARAVQGIGAAIIFPVSLAMLTIVFPPAQRGAALGTYSAIGSVFLALGPFVGGFLTDSLSWRWIFWLNPPIVTVITLVMLATWRQPRPVGPRPRIDPWGLLTLVGGLGMLVFALMQGPEWGWSQPLIPALLVGGTVALTLFVLVERRTAMPLIDIDLFRGATFGASNLVIFTAQFGQMAIVVFGALYLQHVLQMTPFVAGLALLAAVGPAPLMGAATGRLADRIGARPVALGALALTAAALLWLAVAVDWDSYGVLVPAFVVLGAAICALYSAPRKAAMGVIAVAQQGQSGGILMTAQLLGGTIGMTVCGTLLAVTGDFGIVFLAPAALTFVVLVICWFALEHPTGTCARPTTAGPARGPGGSSG